VRAQNKGRYANVLLYWGSNRKKCNGHRKSFQKKIDNFKKRVVTPTFYVMTWKWQAYSTRDYFLVESKRSLDRILAEPEEGCQ